MKSRSFLTLFIVFVLTAFTQLMAQSAKSDSALSWQEKLRLKQVPRMKAEIEQITEKIKLEPGNGGNYYKRGELNVSVHNYDEATADFNQAIFLNKNFLGAYIGRSQAQQGAKVGAGDIAKDFKPALKIALTNGYDCLHRGTKAYGLGFKEEAIADMKKALSFKPSENVSADGMKIVEPNFSIFVYQQLILMLKQTGKTAEAADYQKELHAKHPNAH